LQAQFEDGDLKKPNGKIKKSMEKQNKKEE